MLKKSLYNTHPQISVMMGMLWLEEGENSLRDLERLEAERSDMLRFVSEKSPGCH